MATLTGPSFTISDSLTGQFTLVASPQNSAGSPEPVTSPAYSTTGLDTTIIANFASADGLTATFNLASPAKDGTTSVGWSGVNSLGATITGTATFIVTGAAVSVVFTLTEPSS
jgi:hypothetical protein